MCGLCADYVRIRCGLCADPCLEWPFMDRRVNYPRNGTPEQCVNGQPSIVFPYVYIEGFPFIVRDFLLYHVRRAAEAMDGFFYT